MNGRADHELWLGGAFAVLAGIGWWLHSVALALVGVVGLLTALVFWTWQRTCLEGVRYGASLTHSRATFGEEVALEIEIVNDKLVPLTWLEVEHRLPPALTVGDEAGTVRSGPPRVLAMVLPMLPYQRVRRQATVVCDQRGEHTFGPADLRSGDPVGYRQRFHRVREEVRLLVYPKVFTLEPPGVASRVLLGDQRSRALLGDPSRVAGVREYRPGDPLRHVDWRATARSTALLVREHEPTASLRVAVFVDPRSPRTASAAGTTGWLTGPELTEVVIATAASVVADLAGRGISVGLYSCATVQGREIACPPSNAPSALPELLEVLARASPYGRLPFADVLTGEGGHLAGSTSVVVVAATFSERTQVAMAMLRRRRSVTTISVAPDPLDGTGGPEVGQSVPAGISDVHLTASVAEDWRRRQTLELAGS